MSEPLVPEVVDEPRVPGGPVRGAGVSHVLLRGRASGPGAYRMAADALTAAILDDMSRALEAETLDPT